jgi:hypothetical protein
MLSKFHRPCYMKKITFSAAVILISVCASSQNLIGYKGKDILKYMKMNHSEMNYNNVVNNKFSYLKFSDDSETLTTLFFLNPDSVCKSVRTICDKSIKTLKLKELNSMYQKHGENKWIDLHDGRTYTIDLKDGDWSFVISIETEK